MTQTQPAQLSQDEAIEQLVRDRIELPAFSALDRLARRVRTLVNGRYFALIDKRLTADEKQKISLGRGLVRSDVAAILFDEPLTVIDPQMKWVLRSQLKELHRQFAHTMVYVTHDQTEALTMGDRIAVLNFGVLQQVGTPRELYEHPNNVFVAGFIGSPAMNLSTFDVDAASRTARAGQAAIPLSDEVLARITPEDNGQIILGFRPEALELVDASAQHTIPVEVDFVEELGSDSFIYGHLAGGGWRSEGREEGDAGEIVLRTPPLSGAREGDVIHARIKDGGLHAFSKATGTRI